MAGHSKWANIKHRKGAQDAKRSKLFSKLSKEITVASISDPNPKTNNSLRIAIAKAKSYSMPKKNIENAIKNANKDNSSHNFKEISYAVNILGVSFLINCLTDNFNRTYSHIQSVVTKANGMISNPNSISYLFNLKGVLEIDASNKNEEELMIMSLEMGAEDFQKKQDSFLIYTLPQDFSKIKEKLELQGVLDFKTSEIKSIPTKKVQLSIEKSENILDIINKFEDIDDVQNVYHNLDETILDNKED